jgi:uncharacterized alkaline shock family protein YloU
VSPALPRPATIGVRRVATLPRLGAVHTPVVVTRRAPASIGVERPYKTPPEPQSRHLTPARDETEAGAGKVTVADRVVVKVARRAAAENADVGGVGTRLLGAAIPGLDKLGAQTASLNTLPSASAEVDGALAYLELELSVRYPAPLIDTLAAVRDTVQQRVHDITGLNVAEIDITITALVTDLPNRPRVR